MSSDLVDWNWIYYSFRFQEPAEVAAWQQQTILFQMKFLFSSMAIAKDKIFLDFIESNTFCGIDKSVKVNILEFYSNALHSNLQKPNDLTDQTRIVCAIEQLYPK